MGAASPGPARSLAEERRKQMESSPSHSPPTQHQLQGRPLGTFLPVLPLIPQYLQTQGLHGAHRRELLREAGLGERRGNA